MHQSSNQLQTITTLVIWDNFKPNDLLAKLFYTPISDKPTGTQNQASYFDERDYFAYQKSFDDADLGGKNNLKKSSKTGFSA